jgi:hypothetical protein
MKTLAFDKDGHPLEWQEGWRDPARHYYPMKMWEFKPFPDGAYIRASDGYWFRSDLTPWLEDQLPAVIKAWLLIL